MFIGRKNEISELEKRYKMTGFQMFVIYGRRRVGKTRIIQEFCRDKHAIYHVGIQQNKEMLLQYISRDILKTLPTSGSEFIHSFQSWQEAFHYVAVNAKNQRIVMVIDEYPYIAQSDPAISSILQKTIDQEWKQTQIFLILCGSSMSFMETQVLGYQSPLYGRRTAQMKITPLPYWESIEFFSGWSWQDKLLAYGICGGIPQYLEFLSVHNDLVTAVQNEFLALSGHLAEEPANLMQQEMREPALYNAIVGAIARGSTKQNEIATTIGKSAKDITSYLKALIDLGIIEKKQPIEEKNRKRTIYSIADNLYRFWYKFIPSCLSLISMNMSDMAWKDIIEPELDTFFGNVYESVCLQYVQKKIKDGVMKPIYLEYGKWWGNNPVRKREEDIDIVATNKDSILVGECKWRKEKMDVDILELLQERGELIRRGRKINYILFSKSGFTKNLKSLAAQKEVQLIKAEEMTFAETGSRS